MSSYVFLRMATTVYSTKRNVVSGTLTTAATTNLASILGTPRVPASNEILERYQLQSPRQVFVIYFEGAPDIKLGDYIVDDTVDLPVRGLGKWPTSQGFLEVIVEETK